MKYTDEMYREDNIRWENLDVDVHLNYYANNLPVSIYLTDDDVRFYAFLCRKAQEKLSEYINSKEVPEERVRLLRMEDDSARCCRCNGTYCGPITEQIIYCTFCGSKLYREVPESE